MYKLLFFSLMSLASEPTLDEKLLLAKCQANESDCEKVADFYEDKGDYDKMLFYQRRYYAKENRGRYPYLEHRYGNKETSYPLVLKNCNADSRTCIFYLRYITDHPQYSQIVAGAMKACEEQTGSSSGATACTIVGAYHYKKNDFIAAFSAWNRDCALGNPSGCLLVAGSSEDQEQQLFGATRFCTVNPLGWEVHDLNLKKRTCQTLLTTGVVPPEVSEYSKRLVSDFVKEQH
jgi:hypothetical protein